jgi:hypothetical protein
MNYKLVTSGGEHIDRVAEKAKGIATQPHFSHNAVEFDFNDIKCVVDKHTNLEWLSRDYMNAHRMRWRQVGPSCLAEYPADVLAELERRNKKAEAEEAERQREYTEKADRERKVFDDKVSGVAVEIMNAEEYNDWRSKNTDEYGAAIFEYAEGWAKLMQVEIAQGKAVRQCAETTSHELGFLGITGFMYGAAVSILSKCWKHGEELRKWHNKEYGHEGDGVVNPAVLTIQPSLR